MLKGKEKIKFVEADNLQKLEEDVNRELEAIQVNVNNVIINVGTVGKENGYITQIAYAELEQEPLMESDKNVCESR